MLQRPLLTGRVREAAAAALVNFFEPEDTPSFENKLRPILTGLINAFMKDGPLYIKERTLAAIGKQSPAVHG